LKHGYTNDTETDGRTVTKRYRGPDADRRRRREEAIYSSLGDRLPLPRVLASEPNALILERLAGVPGQELLEQQPTKVLRAVGRLARRVHEMDLDQVVDRLVADDEGSAGGVLVHGDFGPQNVLLDPSTVRPTALLDWEFAHLGRPVEDLAWAEWIVRTHHAPLVDQLWALYDGYGERPDWAERHAAMITKCEWALDFAGRWEPEATPVAEMWRQRLSATRAFVA
jgi:aminoglycoside phosphotransferase